MPRTQPRFEEVDGLRVPLGGKNGYKGVRGKQGRKKNMYQGVTPRKQHRTGPKKTAKEAAVALAHLRHDIELGIVGLRSAAKPQPPSGSAGRQIRARASGRMPASCGTGTPHATAGSRRGPKIVSSWAAGPWFGSFQLPREL